MRSSARIQITHFPKALWVVEATLYRLTDRIESVKAANVLLLLAAAAAASAAFLELNLLTRAAAGSLSLLVPVGWIARYVPQLWLVPVLGAACLLASQRRPWRVLGWVVTIVLWVDLALVAVPRYRRLLAQDRAMEQRLTTLAASNGIVTHIPRWIANRTRLTEAGVDFTEVTTPEELPCVRPRLLPGSDDSRYCPRSAGGDARRPRSNHAR